MSYRNASADTFGPAKISNVIHIEKPTQPVLNRVDMNNSTTLRLYIDPMAADNKIGISDGGSSVNTNNAVFLQEISLQVKYQKDSGSKESHLEFGTKWKDFKDDQNDSTYYDFLLPAGLSNGIFGDDKIQWEFSIKVKNNIIDEWSEERRLMKTMACKTSDE